MFDLLFNYILPFILLISVLVFVHEFGHYYVARKMGVRITDFSIGFGKEIFSVIDKYGTKWKICILPLGGYVKMFGDQSAASDQDSEFVASLTEQEKQQTFYYKKIWQKALVVVAGPFANYLFALIIIAFYFCYFGYPSNIAKISQVVPNSAAAKNGLLEGDIIIALNEQKVKSFNDLTSYMALNLGEEVKLKILRNDQELIQSIIPDQETTIDLIGNKVKTYRIGVSVAQGEFVKKSLLISIVLAARECYQISLLNLQGLKQIILGQRSINDLGGPIKIAQFSGKTYELGIRAFIWLMAVLSINLGLINLLPIPVLDGGHLLFLGIEKIFGKRKAELFQTYGFKIGFAFLITLTILISVNDFKNLLLSFK